MILTVLFVAPVLLSIWRAKQGEKIFVRKIPGVDALDDAVGRAVELGRPVSFTTGGAGVGPVLYACLGVLAHVARRVAKLRHRLLVPCNDPEGFVLTSRTVEAAFRQERALSRYDHESVRFLSSEQFAYASGYMGMIHRENVGSALMFGTFAAESLILAEAGQQVGAMQVAATVSNEQIPFFICSCDYTLIGEELFAAGAYLSQDPVQTGSLRGQDFAKFIVLLLVILGSVQATAYSLFYDLEQKDSPLAVALTTNWDGTRRQ